MKPVPIRLSTEHLDKLDDIASRCDFSKQELIRIALDRLFERLEAGEEFVEQRILSLSKKPSACASISAHKNKNSEIGYPKAARLPRVTIEKISPE